MLTQSASIRQLWRKNQITHPYQQRVIKPWIYTKCKYQLRPICNFVRLAIFFPRIFRSILIISQTNKKKKTECEMTWNCRANNRLWTLLYDNGFSFMFCVRMWCGAVLVNDLHFAVRCSIFNILLQIISSIFSWPFLQLIFIDLKTEGKILIDKFSFFVLHQLVYVCMHSQR